MARRDKVFALVQLIKFVVIVQEAIKISFD